jgi:hypothetical protein
LTPVTLTLNPAPFAVGSGKLDTPWERMQWAKFSASCWSWDWLEPEPELPEEFELLAELEPHATIAVLARISAAPAGSLDAIRGMTHTDTRASICQGRRTCGRPIRPDSIRYLKSG